MLIPFLSLFLSFVFFFFRKDFFCMLLFGAFLCVFGNSYLSFLYIEKVSFYKFQKLTLEYELFKLYQLRKLYELCKLYEL